jgi:hypothetical protein
MMLQPTSGRQGFDFVKESNSKKGKSKECTHSTLTGYAETCWLSGNTSLRLGGSTNEKQAGAFDEKASKTAERIRTDQDQKIVQSTTSTNSSTAT